MNKNKKMGPQGTQVFEINEINKMVAKEIVDSQGISATMPALVGISQDVIGQQYILTNNKTEIGRRANADISLNDASVSAMHAHILTDGIAWKVLNLLSSNGTFVNGKKIVEQEIIIGDIIGFAGSEFVFSLVEDDTLKATSNINYSLITVGVLMVLAIASALYFLL